MVLRWDCETECAYSRGVVCNELTNSVSLGSERCLKRWELLTTSVCICACASRCHVWQTWRNNNEVLSAGLVPARGLEASTTCDFLRLAENPRWRLIPMCTRERAQTWHMHVCTHTCTHTHSPGHYCWIFTSAGTIPSRAETHTHMHTLIVCPNAKRPCVSFNALHEVCFSPTHLVLEFLGMLFLLRSDATVPTPHDIPRALCIFWCQNSHTITSSWQAEVWGDATVSPGRTHMSILSVLLSQSTVSSLCLLALPALSHSQAIWQ